MVAAASSPLGSSEVYRELQGCTAALEAERRNLDVLIEDAAVAATPLSEVVVEMVYIADLPVLLRQHDDPMVGRWDG